MAETLLLLSGRTTYLEPARAEGEVAELSLNSDGRLRVASKPGGFPVITGALTTLSQSLVADVSDASNIVLHIKNTGSAAMAAGAFVFEGSIDSTDGTDGTFFTLQAARSDSNTIETGRGTSSLAAGAGQSYAWELSVNAVRWFRIRCSTAVTASSIAFWTIVRGSYATEPIPALQSHPVTVSGTVNANPPTGSNYNLISAASNNPVNVRNSAGNIHNIAIFNPTAATVYVKLFNKATVSVPGTDVPFWSVPVVANGFYADAFGTPGIRFNPGLSIAITAGPLALDTAAVAAGVQLTMTTT